ncbi:endonuclease III [Rhizobiaceae bacterium]|nr:endonuclease III [Rhizobiaceae bacterium]
MPRKLKADRLLPPAEVEAAYRLLRDAMPGRTPTAKGPKDQPDPFRSCVSCMLSAQSRDANTAAASRALFALADTPAGILALPDEEVAAAIKPCGLYNMKTKNLKKMCAYLLDELDGVVPTSREGLMTLPGIGRKCADIVMSFTFGEAVIAVDTHVHRVSNRIGLARGKTEAQTAQSLEDRSPGWAMEDGHFWLLQFGKQVCTSRSPKCETCFLNHICAWYTATGEKPVGKPGYGGVSATKTQATPKA